MNFFGYEKEDERSELPSSLREVTLVVDADELGHIINFLQKVRSEWGRYSPQSHWHFQDYWPEWAASYPDLIIACQDGTTQKRIAVAENNSIQTETQPKPDIAGPEK